MEWDMVGGVLGGVVVLLVLAALMIFTLSVIVSWVNITFFENIPTKAWYKDNLIYDGKSAGINVYSSGDDTTIRTYGGFLYWFPQKIYTDKGQCFRVEGIKER